MGQKQQRASEDRYQAKQIGPFRYFAIFDGHGGSHEMGPQHVGQYCVEHLHEFLADKLGQIDLNNETEVMFTISQTFVDFDAEMYSKGLKFGTTCIVILIDDVRNKIYQVNLGDSRSILFTGTKIVSVTVDHEPDDPNEKKRIDAAKGFVQAGRVVGSLAISRAFGDYIYKRNGTTVYDPVNGMVIAVPAITVIPKGLVANAVLTSDAPYEGDVFTDQLLVDLAIESAGDVAEMSANQVQFTGLPELIAKGMVDTIVRFTSDDTTIIYVII